MTAATLALGSVVALSTPAAAVDSTFEIDGNQVTEGGIDWETADPSIIRDPIGNADTTTFAGGDSEANGWPNWGGGNPGTPSGKSDLGNVFVDSEIVTDGVDYTQWLHLGWDRDGDSGTVQYFIELNQLPNRDALNPDRSVGDVRIAFAELGNGNFVCEFVRTWDGSAWVDPVLCAGSATNATTNTESIEDLFDSPNANDAGQIEADKFVEGSINLTDLGIGDVCPATGFSTLNMRTQTGGSGNSALKDLATGEIDVPSLCSQLTILKESEDGVPLSGATFEISPNPTGEGPDPLEFTTGEDGTFTFDEIGEDLWGTEFTVTETAAPDGYLLPADRDQTITIDAGESASLTFVDPMPWEPLTIDVEGSAEQFITRTWTNDKQVDGEDQIDLPADQSSVELEYTIEVHESAEEVTAEDRSITVVVDNPNAENVVGTLEVTIGGEACSVDGAVDIDPVNDGLQLDFGPDITGYDVTCPNPPLDGTVEATVTWDLGDYPQTQAHIDDPDNAGTDSASDSVEITADVTDEGVQSVDVYDDFLTPDLEPELLGTVVATGAENTTTFDVTQVIDVGLGECIQVVNDGYIVETGAGADGDRIDEAQEVVTVCREDPADLTIFKANADGLLLPGATFTITPNPVDPAGDDPLTFSTGETGEYTFEDVVYFGEYTVTETVAPEGYLLPADRDQVVTLAPGSDEALTFIDPLAWEPLELDLTASQFVTRSWTNDKSADQTTIDLRADEESATITYTIEVMESDTVLDESADPSRSVSVTVTNPNAGAVTGTLDADLDGAFCTLEGDDADELSYEFPSGETVLQLDCPNPPLFGEVEATVTWELADYPQTQDHIDNPGDAGTDSASDTLDLAEETTDNGLLSVDVWDDFTNPDAEPEYLGTVDATGSAGTSTFQFPKEFTVAQGECLQVDNTAYVVEEDAGADGDRIDESSASVTICRDAPAELTIVKVGEDGTPIPGVTFEVSPNPLDPAAEEPLTVVTGEDGTYTVEQVADFGEYDVTEVSVPAESGYLLPPPGDRTQTVELVEGETTEVEFTDPLAWQPLTVDVSGGQFVTRTWTNDKQVDGNDTVLLPADQESVTLEYTIEVVESDTVLDESETSPRSVTVTVTNPNAGAVTGTVDVDLDGTVCTLEGTELAGWENEFAPGATVLTVDCPDPPLFGEVEATVTWDLADYPQTQDHIDNPDDAGTDSASDTLDLAEETTDNGLPSVDVWDDFVNPDLEPAFLGTVDATGSANTTTFDVTQEIDVPLGECVEVVNDGYLVETEAGADGDRIDSATEVVDVCREAPADLTVFKANADGLLLPGATFTISPNPVDPAGDDPLTFSTGETGEYTFSDVVYFGEYTVTETIAPEGYLLPADRDQVVTLTTGSDEALTFVDPLAWEPLTVEVSAEQFVTRTWTDDKQADATTIDLRADEESATINYTIEVMESDTVLDESADPSRSVAVTVTNPNAGAVTGTVDVDLDGTVCTLEGTDLDGWENEFPSGDTVLMVDCPNPPLFGEVEATVTWELADYPQTQDHIDNPDDAGTDTAGDTLDLAEATTDNGLRSVDVWDDITNPDADPELLGTVDAVDSANTTPFEFSKEFEVAQGECLQVDNTVFLVETGAGAGGERIDVSSASVSICRGAHAELTIVKVGEDETELEGATFEITPNPLDPAAEEPLTVVTGEDGTYTVEQIADFGTYLVEETVAPPGYLLPADRTRSVELVEGETTEVEFIDPLVWEPMEITVEGEGTQYVSRTFTVDKEPSTHPVTLPADQEETTVEFVVQVVEGPTTLDDATLSAAVTVSNPNDYAMTGTVAATFEGSACLVDAEDADGIADGLQYSFGPGETAMALTCENVDDFVGTLAATVTWDLAAYPQTQDHIDTPAEAGADEATDSLDIDPSVMDNGPTSVEVWDDWIVPDYAPVLLGTVDAEEAGAVTEFPVAQSVSVEQGRCVLVTNEAYLLDGARELDRDGASVQVCRDVPVTPPQPPLPQTGTNTALAAIGALLLIGTGAGMMFVRRRTRG
ncbi:prealbumin-like fold domain-containing protein [Isoptericola haloaureus]|uniref:Prealbumin-like fold domain-containing protein n=1 Tax=Isoptericola haloaureus TaxID=1542902 RepID=A0ABU7Z8F9_9MICO